ESFAMIGRDTNEAVSAARHAVGSAEAALDLATEDFNRYSALFKDGSGSQRRFQEATRTYKTAQADLQIANARLNQAEANRKQTAIADQQLKASRHAIGEARAAVE